MNYSPIKETPHDCRHFEANAQRPGSAKPLNVTSCRFRILEACLFLEEMAGVQPYRFEPERVPNPEDSESENELEEVNDRLQGTFLCSERCKIMPTQSGECVCCREQLARAGQKTKKKVEFLAYTALFAVNGKTIFFNYCFIRY